MTKIRLSNEAFEFFRGPDNCPKGTTPSLSGHESDHLERSGLPGAIWSSRSDLVAHQVARALGRLTGRGRCIQHKYFFALLVVVKRSFTCSNETLGSHSFMKYTAEKHPHIKGDSRQMTGQRNLGSAEDVQFSSVSQEDEMRSMVSCFLVLE